MRLLPRRPSSVPADVAIDGAVEFGSVEPGAIESGVAAPKGRPTPKRRDADPRRGPVAAPKTRKEAAQRQRQQLKQSKKPSSSLSPAQRRQRMLSGDPSALPRRDAGPLRAFARDYVDSHRMLSNGLLILFPLIALSFFLKTAFVNLVILAIFFGVVVEWMITGRKIMGLAASRGIDKGKNTAMAIGFYAGTRAYLPRNWRVPRPRVALRDEI
ncbi:MAG: hypothetical protein JWM76_2338 [Pseudonocardiales bacterium]|nr:hypothetical protein [Pseudonocardiales bacterium]